MNKIAFLLIPALALCLEASAQSLKLRASAEDLNQIEKPALLQYTNPSEGDNAYSIDAALKYEFFDLKDRQLNFSIAIEGHKNTLIDKEQDTRSINLGTYKRWGFDCRVGENSNRRICNDYAQLDFSIKDLKDQGKDNDHTLAILEASFLNGDWWLNGIAQDGLALFWAPTFAIEFDDVRESESDPTGNSTRLYSSLEIGWYPLFESQEGRLSVSATHSYWDTFSNSNEAVFEDSYEETKISLRYEVSPEGADVKFSFSLEWVNGENPRTKLPDQEFVQFGFGVRI